MREIIGDLDRWLAVGLDVAVARVIDINGSGPLRPGAAMGVTVSSEVAGAVSGGCVESAVILEALDVLDTGGRRVISFGYSDDEAFSVGLTCGGTVRLFLEPFDWGAVYSSLRSDLLADRPVALATVVAGPHVGAKLLVHAEEPSMHTECASRTEPALDVFGSLGSEGLDRAAACDARAWLTAGRSGILHYGSNGEALEQNVSVFVESFAAPSNLLVLGAADFASALVRLAKLVGYRVVVCDAREVFATSQRFPMADEVVVSWPDRFLMSIGSDLGYRDAVCVLTHDAKFDVPAIVAALSTDVGYIGVMGSRITHRERFGRLMEAGVTEAELKRLRSPIGLDIGASTPEETAVSIIAEIIANRSGRDARALSFAEGPIH